MDLKVVCVKWGAKFSAEYVNVLFAMVERHLTLPHRFLCLTEDPADLDPGIGILDLRPGFEYCWNKLELFRPGVFGDDDRVLYFDLDVVIAADIDGLATVRPQDTFVGLLDWYGFWNPHYNSSVMRFHGNRHADLYTRLVAGLADGRVRWGREYDEYLGTNDKVVLWEGDRRYAGDQDWISRHVHPAGELRRHRFPRPWIRSYRKHARQRLPRGCKVVVFHGSPKPHEVVNDYVREHWR